LPIRQPSELEQEGFVGARQRIDGFAALHYKGQSFELVVAVSDAERMAHDSSLSRGTPTGLFSRGTVGTGKH
jgi:hypothetical protein